MPVANLGSALLVFHESLTRGLHTTASLLCLVIWSLAHGRTGWYSSPEHTIDPWDPGI